MEPSESSLLGNTLVSIVRQHIRKYLPELLKLVSELWPSFGLPAVNRPVQDLTSCGAAVHGQNGLADVINDPLHDDNGSNEEGDDVNRLVRNHQVNDVRLSTAGEVSQMS